eukprot:747943-Hanusia_phi.AAC.1
MLARTMTRERRRRRRVRRSGEGGGGGGPMETRRLSGALPGSSCRHMRVGYSQGLYGVGYLSWGVGGGMAGWAKHVGGKHAPLMLYVLIFSLLAVLIKQTTRGKRFDYEPSSVMLVAEILKAAVSLLFFTLESRLEKQTVPQILYHSFLHHDWKMVVPAFLYTVCNLLTFSNLANYEPQIYTILMNIKILITALFWSVLFRKAITVRVIISLIILMCGCALANIDCDKLSNGLISSFRTSHFMFVLLQASVSSLAAVCNELLLKKVSPLISSSLNRSNFVLYSMSSMMNAAVLSCSGAAHWVAQVTWRLVCIVILLVCGGLCTAYTLKNFSAITKAFATSCEILLTAMLANVLMSSRIQSCFWMSFSLIIISLAMYNADNVNLESLWSFKNPLSSRSLFIYFLLLYTAYSTQWLTRDADPAGSFKNETGRVDVSSARSEAWGNSSIR